MHELNSKASDTFLLDGIIRFGENGQHQRCVQRVRFETLSVGAYEDETLHTVGSDIWLQSIASKASNIWYRLKRPAPEYLRYHKPFVWLADLAKHIIDYLHVHKKVKLHDFRNTFSSWLKKIHGSDRSFRQWHNEHSNTDFRQIVAAHAAFLYNQAGQLGLQYASHPLWGEIDPNALTAIPRQPENRRDRRTVVTPYVYQCFSHMPWSKFLNPLSSQNGLHKSVESDSPPGAPTTKATGDHRGNAHPSEHAHITLDDGTIRTGDIVAIPSDTNTAWKSKDKYWYAYVQGRKNTTHGHQLRLIWIYRPADTACQDMKYPHPDELFLSDHCNCGDAPVYAPEIAHKVRVAMFGSPGATRDADYFIRQKHSSADSYWVTLQPSDFRCRCNKDEEPLKPEYSIGDTLLLRATSPKETLEPVVLVACTANGDPSTALVRRLLRKKDDYGDLDADPNELVYSSRTDICDISTIIRPCHVRCYTLGDRQEGRIPAPYNRNGTGDCYYIILGEKESGDLEAIGQLHPVMNQGFDPAATTAMRKPMRGLDLFCGGGNFGRGLEEGGAVEMEWAVDYFNEAIHTYHANAETSTKLYNESVNDYLSDAIHGRRRQIVAQKGEVCIICAGSPCQGFSLANRLYANDTSLLNVSLVASVVAFVDFYRPKYLIMENVLGMASGGGKGIRQSNVFAQVLCALVGLGYQVRPMLLDSWNFGAPQGRSRLFITATAPGLEPLSIPAASHSHPDSVVGRALGKTANGLPFGAREWTPTPFDYLSIDEATKDLPENPDGRTTYITYPDHRVTKNFSALDHVRISCVPRFPPGMTFVKSAKLGWQPPPQMAAWHWHSELRGSINSKAWQRAKSNALLPTVLTENAPNEALTGSALHWDAHRPLTVMEARRAQGYPDEEVIIGKPAMQWKIVGNSVTRQVAIAFGMKLREAWLANGSLDNGLQARQPGGTGEEDDLGNNKGPLNGLAASEFMIEASLSSRIDPSNERRNPVEAKAHPIKGNQNDLSEDGFASPVLMHKTLKLPESTSTGPSKEVGSSDPIEISSRESSISTVQGQESLHPIQRIGLSQIMDPELI